VLVIVYIFLISGLVTELRPRDHEFIDLMWEKSHYKPHQKLLGDGVLNPVPLFCLICTIISNKTGIFD